MSNLRAVLEKMNKLDDKQLLGGYNLEILTAFREAMALLEKCPDVLREYVNVCYSVNDPNDFSPKIADGGHPARGLLNLLESHGIGGK